MTFGGHFCLFCSFVLTTWQSRALSPPFSCFIAPNNTQLNFLCPLSAEQILFFVKINKQTKSLKNIFKRKEILLSLQ
jgi:hypothetical protein